MDHQSNNKKPPSRPRKRAGCIFIAIFVAMICLMLTSMFDWQIFVWLDAVYYVPRFQQALDEQCPNSGRTVTAEGLSYDPIHEWGDSEAYCYIGASEKYICICSGNSK
jgi:hypothetical protein